MNDLNETEVEDEIEIVDALLTTLMRRVVCGRVRRSGSGYGLGEGDTSFECANPDAADEFSALVRRHIRRSTRVLREALIDE